MTFVFLKIISINSNTKFTSPHKIIKSSSFLWKIIGNKMNKMLIYYNSNHINYYVPISNNCVTGQSPTWNKFIVHFILITQVNKKCHFIMFWMKNWNQNIHFLIYALVGLEKSKDNKTSVRSRRIPSQWENGEIWKQL